MQLSNPSIKTVLIELAIVVAFVTFLSVAISGKDAKQNNEISDTISITNNMISKNN